MRVQQDVCPNCGAVWYAFTEAAASNGHTYTRYCNWCGRVESLQYPPSPIGDGHSRQWIEVYPGSREPLECPFCGSRDHDGTCCVPDHRGTPS